MSFTGQAEIPIDHNFQHRITPGEHDGAVSQTMYYHRPEARHPHENGVPMTKDEYLRRTVGTLVGAGALGAAIIGGAIWGSGDVFDNSQGSFEPQPMVEVPYDNRPALPEVGYGEQSATSITDFSAVDQSVVLGKY